MVVSGVIEGKRVKVGVSVPEMVGAAEMDLVVDGVKGERVAEIVNEVVGVTEGVREKEGVIVTGAVTVGLLVAGPEAEGTSSAVSKGPV